MTEQSELAARYRAMIDAQNDWRDEWIRWAIANGISRRKVAEAMGVTRQLIHKILQDGKP